MKRVSESVSVIGLGYVGLCTSAMLASKGIRTIGVDIDEKVIKKLAKGQPPFYEPGLPKMLKTSLQKKQMEFTSDISRCAQSRVTFITVGTPSREDGSIDLTYVKSATKQLGSAIKDTAEYHLVVIKSTVTPGTTSDLVRPALERSSGKSCGQELGLCANPEFLSEGSAIKGSLHPSKIVIGAIDEKSGRTLKQLYHRLFLGKNVPTIVTDTTTAETIKYASNALLATRVSSINTIANICQLLPGVDVQNVARAVGLDPRIGSLYLKAGPGYGGSCFHKDLQAIISLSRELGYDPLLLSAVEEVNQRQISGIINLAKKFLGSLDNRRIAVLGLAFKKDTDDVREAPAMRLIEQLLRNGASIAAYDPVAMENAEKILSKEVQLSEDPLSPLKGADCCIVMTEWDEFRKLRPKDFITMMKTPNVIDARRLLNPDAFEGMNYVAVGLGGPKT